MPELPEIETIKRGLQTEVAGKTITEIERRDVSPAKKPAGQFIGSESDVNQFVIGATIANLKRRAKILIIELSSNYALLFHLKMTGQIVLVEPDGERFGGGHPTKSLVHPLPDTSTRTIFSLNDGSKLYYNDQRKFGWIKVLPIPLIEKEPFFQKVGPEPFSQEWNAAYLASKLQKRTQRIKTALLNQELVAGIGNIYADEALSLAAIHPQRSAQSLNESEIAALVEAVPAVMKDSIERGGTSFSDYVNHLGVSGDYLRHARVYKREGQPCLQCGSEIKKVQLNGRGTHFCPVCQQ